MPLLSLIRPQFIGAAVVACLTFANRTSAQANDTLYLPDTQVFIDEALGMALTNVDTRTLDSAALNQYVSLAPGRVFTWSPDAGRSLVGPAHLLRDLTTGREMTLYFTSLPIVSINPDETIVDEPDVYADFKLVERSGARVESGVGIQYRGAYTLNYEKKSMEIEFWNDRTGDDKQDYQLLGMTSDDDWNLQAMYVERLRIRTKVGFDLWRGMNTLPYADEEPDAINGVRNEYVELFLSGQYRGVYALGEKINRKQLKLKAYKDGIRGELYSGADLGPSTTFSERTDYDNGSEYWGGFEYKHPDEEVDWSRLDDFIGFVVEASEEDFLRDYPKYIDVGNAVDYFLFVNVLNGWDNIAKNTYLARYNADQPYFYVPWDLDNTMITGWDTRYDTTIAGIFTNNHLFMRLVRDCRPGGFNRKVEERWTALRRDALSLDTWLTAFRTQYAYLENNGIYIRESIVWPEAAPDEFELASIETWLTDRMDYLDGLFAKPCEDAVAVTARATSSLLVSPNPATDFITLHTTDAHHYGVQIYDALGRPRLQTEIPAGQSTDVGGLPPGIYNLVARAQDGTATSVRFVMR